MKLEQTLTEQLLDFGPVQRGSELLLPQRALNNFALLLLEGQNLLFHGAARDELVAGDDTGLADAVGAISGLVFDGGIPPWVEVNHGVRAGQVQAHAAGFKTDEENGRRAALKFLHDLAAVRR